MKGKIECIKRLQLSNDGKGIRTMVYMFGCPMKCKYCVNPGAKEKGNYNKLSADDLADMLQVNALYFRATGGGITFTGCEPLMQAEFIKEVIQKLPGYYNFAVETSLAVPFRKIKILAPYIDTFYVDIKSLDSDEYKKHTGKKPKLVYGNLEKLKNLVDPRKIEVRVPVLSSYVGYRNREQQIETLLKMGFTNIKEFNYQIRPPQDFDI